MGRAHKNNRKQHGPKVSRKPNHKRMKRRFTDDRVRLAWDVHKTAKQNYAALGLATGANSDADLRRHVPGRLAEELGVRVEWSGLPASVADVLPKDVNPTRPPFYVPRDECEYLVSRPSVHVSVPVSGLRRAGSCCCRVHGC